MIKLTGKGSLVLPFEPLTISFKDVQYYVDTPAVIIIKVELNVSYEVSLVFTLEETR